MKNFTRTTLVLLSMSVLMAFSGMANAKGKLEKNDPEKTLSAFPKAEEGMVRHVIQLNKKSNESLYKVEIIPGKMMSVDCNNHVLMGTLTEKNLSGWGYTYFEFQSEGQTASTMMMCNQPNQMKFVTGQTSLVRYNSKLPIVIYAPKGCDVKYRIWKADKERTSVEK